MSNQLQVNVTSEIGKLNGVILHTPGRELQNMTPETAQRALYSDILNLTVAQEEYTQLKGVLQKTATTYEVSDLLKDVLKSDKVRFDIINRVCTNENAIDIRDYLLGLSSDELGRQLIEGVVMQKDSLTKFLSKDKYSLQPLHNFFFTRDSSIAVRDRVLIGRMANKVRMRESLIMETIFNNHPGFSTHTVNPINGSLPLDELSVEGGDVLIARKDIMLIGSSSRTSTQGIDFIINRLKDRKVKKRFNCSGIASQPRIIYPP
jgi:arginine deiminase